jgi:hypothetical protein
MPQQKPKHENRHVVIRKGDAFGNLVLCIDCVRNATASFVPRANPPQIMRSFETSELARSHFQGVICIFKANGWTIIHDGRPNFG